MLLGHALLFISALCCCTAITDDELRLRHIYRYWTEHASHLLSMTFFAPLWGVHDPIAFSELSLQSHQTHVRFDEYLKHVSSSNSTGSFTVLMDHHMSFAVNQALTQPGSSFELPCSDKHPLLQQWYKNTRALVTHTFSDIATGIGGTAQQDFKDWTLICCLAASLRHTASRDIQFSIVHDLHGAYVRIANWYLSVLV